MVETSLKRQMSLVPTSCTQTESSVLNVPISKAWESFCAFKLDALCPGIVTKVEWKEGGAGQLGAMAAVTYVDGAVWTIRFNELSEKHHRVGYELLAAEPALTCSSVQGTIELLRVTDTDSTFVSWTTEFSNDADLIVIEDQKHKKHDAFVDMKTTLAEKK